MTDYQADFLQRQKIVHDIKWIDAKRRAMTIQARNKIKPVDLRPNLLESSTLRGGDIVTPTSYEFYYPSQSRTAVSITPAQWTNQVTSNTTPSQMTKSPIASVTAALRDEGSSSVSSVPTNSVPTSSGPCRSGVIF